VADLGGIVVRRLWISRDGRPEEYSTPKKASGLPPVFAAECSQTALDVHEDVLRMRTTGLSPSALTESSHELELSALVPAIFARKLNNLLCPEH
jgi:hypothetical protein